MYSDLYENKQPYSELGSEMFYFINGLETFIILSDLNSEYETNFIQPNFYLPMYNDKSKVDFQNLLDDTIRILLSDMIS